MAILNILQIFGIFYNHLVHFVFIWYIFSCLGIMHHEKSGNPGQAVSVSGGGKKMKMKIESHILMTFRFISGLPDGIFFKPKIPIWVKFGMSSKGRYWYNLWVFWVYFTAIWYNLWKFDKVYGHLVYFPRFGVLYQEKSGNPGLAEAATVFTRLNSRLAGTILQSCLICVLFDNK
jgi:hypothetical protein